MAKKTASNVASRQAKVADMKKAGATADKIAAALGVGVRTIYKDMSALKGKLKVAGDETKVKLKAQGQAAAKAVVAKATEAKETFKTDVKESKALSELRKELGEIKKDIYIGKLEKIVLRQAVQIATLTEK